MITYAFQQRMACYRMKNPDRNQRPDVTVDRGRKGRRQRQFGHRPHRPRGGAIVALLVLLALPTLGVTAAHAQPNTAATVMPTAPNTANAPLDTLHTPAVATAGGGTSPAEMGISRKLLPEAKATHVPAAKTPRRPPRLDDPLGGEYQFHLARKAMSDGDFDLASAKVDEALIADRSQSRYRWWHSSQALKKFDPGAFVWAMPKALRAVVQDPVGQQRLIILGHQGLVLLSALFWSVLVAAYLLKNWHYLAHDISAMMYRDPKHTPRLWLPFLLILGFLFLRPGWVGLLALLSIPLVIQTRCGERRLLVVVWLAACLLLFPNWSLLRNAIPALDPDSETSLLVRASRQAPASNLIATLERKISTANDPERRARLQLALAIQRARRGQYTQSSQLFQTILMHDPTHVAAQIGLANNTYYRGYLDAAINGYQLVRKLAPKHGEIPYNLAQVYFKKLFVPEASDALRDARALGFNPPVWENPSSQAEGYSPVVYLGPTSAELRASSSWEAPNYDPYAHMASWNFFLGCPPLSLFIVLAGSLLMAMAFTFWWSHQNDPRNCGNCNWTICHECSRVHDGVWLCPSCGETADRARSDMVLATLLKNRSVAVRLQHSQRINLTSRILPGAGHLLVGDLGRAIWRLAGVAVALYLVLFAWAFDPAASWLTPGLLLASETIHPVWFPLPNHTWPGWTDWTLAVGGMLLLIMYLLAMIDGTNLRHRIPERFLASAAVMDEIPDRAR